VAAIQALAAEQTAGRPLAPTTLVDDLDRGTQILRDYDGIIRRVAVD
jgi:hypothetical protein